MLLAGIRVVELANMVSGPYCGKLLADMGAEVVKVEQPGLGDPSRVRGPFPKDVPHHECSGLFLALNSNKLGVTLDVHRPDGRRLLMELLADADVFVENLMPGASANLGLDFDTLHKVYPRLVVASVTPFGQTGPYKDYKGTNLVAVNASGLAYFSPLYGGGKDEEPLRPGGSQADLGAGSLAAMGAVGALCIRQTTGLGQQVDVSAQEAMAAWNWHMPYYSYEHRNIGRGRRPWTAPRGVYPCRDGYVYIIAHEESQWQRFKEMMGRPDWAEEDWAKDKYSRGEYCDMLNTLVSAWTIELSKQDIFDLGLKHRVPCAPINTVGEAADSAQFQDREFLRVIEHSRAGNLRYAGTPWKIPDNPAPTCPAPLLGQHNEHVYCQRLGMKRDDLVKLRQDGVI